MVLYSSIDFGYAWIVLTCAVMNNLLIGTFAGGMGVLMVEFTHYFNISRTKTALAGACAMVIGPFLSWILSNFTQKLGVKVTAYLGSLITVLGLVLIFTLPLFWVVFVSYGLIISTGIFMTYQTSLTINQLYFKKNRSLASGLSAFGISAGVLIGPLLTQALLEHYGFTGCMLLLGGVHLQGLISASLFRPAKGSHLRHPTPSHQPEPRDIKKEYEYKTEILPVKHVKLWCSKRKQDYCLFSLFLVAFTFILIGDSFVALFTPMVAENMHIGARERALLVTLMGAAGCIMRPITGLLGNARCVTRDIRPVIYGLSGLLGGILMLLSTLCTTFLHMAFYTSLFGICSGIYFGVMSAVIGDLLSPKHAEIGSGLIMLCHALAFLILFPLSGWLIDYSGHARYACYTYGILQISGGLLSAHLPLMRRKMQSHTEPSSQNVEMTVI